MDDDGAILTCYFRERQRPGGTLPGANLIDLHGRRRTAASILLRGAEGFEREQRSAARSSLMTADDPPLTAVAVDSQPNITAALEETLRLAGRRLVTMERARLLRGEIDPVWLGEDPAEATRLTVHLGRRDMVYQVPAFQAACDLLYRRGIAGATVLSGIDGAVAGRRHRAGRLRAAADAPLMIVAVGGGDRIAMVLPELGGLFREPLMTVAKVFLCKRDGQLITHPRALAAVAPAGAPPTLTSQLKLTVYTSHGARHEGQPVHRAIIARLRATGISGALATAGIWGYHGADAPHGARFPRHHAPAITTVIDTPQLIATAFDVIDPLTAGHGLVTAQPVLTMRRAAVPHDHGLAS